MELRITSNMHSGTGVKILDIFQYVLSIAGTNTFSAMVGTGGIIIPLLSLAISLVIGAIQPNYNPVKQTISQLVHYPHGWLQTTDFLVLGVWLVLLGFKFYSDFARRLTSKMAILSLILAGISFFLICVFPTNFPGSEKTFESMVHEKVAQAICFFFPVSCSLLVPELKTGHRWNGLALYTMATAIMGFILLGIGAVITATDAPLLGILERLILLNAVIWFEVIGIYMIFQQYGYRKRCVANNQVLQATQQMTR